MPPKPKKRNAAPKPAPDNPPAQKPPRTPRFSAVRDSKIVYTSARRLKTWHAKLRHLERKRAEVAAMRGVDGADQEILDALMKEMMKAIGWLKAEVEGRMGTDLE
tara:strand:- start:1475 stop:1789 length:315 start_codon:yes stop_codon:yes gene_type:complete